MIGRRDLLAIAAVLDIALHARGTRVSAKALAERHGLAPRQLETLLRGLVSARILQATRGPRGGYELARERRRVSLGDILRATAETRSSLPSTLAGARQLEATVLPALQSALEDFLHTLDAVTVDEILADRRAARADTSDPGEFVI